MTNIKQEEKENEEENIIDSEMTIKISVYLIQ
jgi:hypothetical protein